MKKYNFNLIMNRDSQAVNMGLPAGGYGFLSVVNPTDYTIEVYQDTRTLQDSNLKEMLIEIPQYTQLTIPIDAGPSFTFIYRQGPIGGARKASCFFTDENLNISGVMGTKASDGTVTIGGDAVGLARSTQLPTNLTPGGRLPVEVFGSTNITAAQALDVNITGAIPLDITSELQLSGDLNINQVNGVVKTDSSSDGLDGFSVSVGTSVSQLAAQPCREVILQADPDNTENIRIGGPTAQVFKLLPGAVMGFPVHDVSKLYIKADGGTQALHGIWRD
ncbi:hypothetical protein [Erysipelothrix tonsillarum]|uniref:hypothetical protein n=1 Tax=Erysipelothrix tonsillarum TaxID=38402 RepID=UPI0039C7F2AC